VRTRHGVLSIPGRWVLAVATSHRPARLTASFGERARGWLTRQGGRIISGDPLMPSFLLIGGKRCGSTTLHRSIIDHPHVLAPRAAKSSHYFDVNHHRGASWYESHFPSRSAAERLAARTGIMPITGESSPYYSFHPLAPQRIAAELPNARLILCARDPVERAWSHYQYEVARGFEDLPFRAALEQESERMHGQHDLLLAGERSASHRHHSYLARGRYIEHLEMVEEHIDRSQIHLVVSEELFVNPEATLNELWKFLQLPARRVEAIPRLKATAPSDLPSADAAWLADYYAPYNTRLVEWLGRDIDWHGSERSES